jgi:hypothetical protein
MQDDTSYSWEGVFNWTKNTPSSDYTNERAKTSAGTGYILDFGYKLNEKFQNALKHAYDGYTRYNIKRPYGPITNNCGKAFSVAYNAIAPDIGRRANLALILPEDVRTFITDKSGMRMPQQYLRGTQNFPKP